MIESGSHTDRIRKLDIKLTEASAHIDKSIDKFDHKIDLKLSEFMGQVRMELAQKQDKPSLTFIFSLMSVVVGFAGAVYVGLDNISSIKDNQKQIQVRLDTVRQYPFTSRDAEALAEKFYLKVDKAFSEVKTEVKEGDIENKNYTNEKFNRLWEKIQRVEERK